MRDNKEQNFKENSNQRIGTGRDFFLFVLFAAACITLSKMKRKKKPLRVSPLNKNRSLSPRKGQKKF